ncbi:hypothetical protein SAMN02745119_01890 [Trichlorobacter thiogenes]|uniref:YARHG domain-containing protein n=2 Tax=Trichlorobacter thiogenes TaxID=115783 RepID=A0A1T4P9U2_9BACT|nr:hypothetical protein SAMN02745119_01890 [Trichlorobacter thiogenes]
MTDRRFRVLMTFLFMTISSVFPAPTVANDTGRAGLSLDIEIGDAFHPYLSRAEQANIWPDTWRDSTIIVHYQPTRLVEGKTKKTTRRFQIFGSLIGVGPTLDPGIKKDVKIVKKHIELPLTASTKDGITTLHCDIPEQADPLYTISNFELFSSTKPFSRLKKLQNFGPLTDEKLRFDLFLSKTKGFKLKTGIIPLPGDYDQGGAITVRASLKNKQSGEEQALSPSNAKDMEDALGKIPDSLKSSLLPDKVPSLMAGSDYSVRNIVMPQNTPRWHGLFRPDTGGGPPKLGTRLEHRKRGSFSTLTLESLGGNDRVISGIIPVKTETWYFLDGRLVRYKGEIRYFPAEYCADGLCDKLSFHEIANRAGSISPTSWYLDFIDGRHTTTLFNEKTWTTENGKFVNPDCQSDGCRRNDAEALDQIKKSYALLEAESRSYLDLFAAKP